MSVILTIRNRFAKIAGAVIAIALISFIISDARNGSFGSLLGGHDSNIMKVNGEKIDPKEYQLRLKEYEVLYTMFNKGRQIDDATRAQMDEQVVQMLVYETAIGEQCDKLGIQTTDDEKKELIYGMNADPMVRQFQIEGNQIFLDRDSHQFNPAIVKEFEKELAEQSQKIDPQGKLREQWDAVKGYVLRMNRINKYNAMMTNGVYAPLFVAKHALEEQNSEASIKYVKIPFTAIADNDVKVTDDDVKAYMSKHAAQYKNDQPTRSIEYVSFDIVPSSADTARALNALNDIKADFANAKDNKVFVSNKSDDASAYTEAYQNKRTFMSRYADTLMEQPVGSVYGPYYENGGYRLTKIADKKTLPDSVKSRMILVITKSQGNVVLTDTAAKMKIDSAIAAIKGGMSWDSVAAKFSDDPGSKQKGGEYTFTLQQRPTLAKEFGDFIFEGKAGETKTVKVSNDNYSGYHYIEILEQNGIAPAVQMATIVKNLAPSDSTVNAIYSKANEFAGKNTTAELYDAAVKNQKLDKRIGDNVKISAFTIPGIGPSREVVRWMFEHKVGEISPVFQLGEQRYVVAKLIAAEDKGVAEVTPANRPMIEQKIREEKKAEMIAKKYSGTLEAIASAAGQQVQQADSVILGGSYVANVGYEPRVIGYCFDPSLQPNTVSPAIKGTGGVFFITVLNRTMIPMPAEANIQMQMLGQQRRNDDMQLMNAMGQLMQQAVVKEADVTYDPVNF